MSSTNRNTRRTGSPDYYRTPVPAILDFFDTLEADWPEVVNTSQFSFDRPFTALDPCAGGDAVHGMSYPDAMKQHALWKNVQKLTTVDIREDSRAEFKADFLKRPVSDPAPEVILTNPPFSIAQEVIEKALCDVAKGGLVVALLRLNYWGSQKRAAFFQKQMPVATYVHAQRMSFSEASGTDSVEYCHAIWQQGRTPKFSLLRRVEPRTVREAQLKCGLVEGPDGKSE